MKLFKHGRQMMLVGGHNCRIGLLDGFVGIKLIVIHDYYFVLLRILS